MQPDQVVGFKPPALSYSYTDHEVILYALGVGAAVDPLDDSELRFVYENHSDFCSLPTFGVIPAFPALGQIMATPGLSFNPMMLLHGEQDLTIHAPVPTEATLTTQGACRVGFSGVVVWWFACKVGVIFCWVGAGAFFSIAVVVITPV